MRTACIRGLQQTGKAELAMKRMLVTCAALAVAAGTAFAQDYPSRPIHMITSAAGGGTDLVARVVAQALAGPLGQAVVVENHPTLVSIETAMKAPADGYTILFTAEPLWTMPYLQKVSFDPLKDFIPVALVGKAPTVLVVHPSVQVNSVTELIALAKAKPGTLNYSAGAVGAASHVAGELFKSAANVDIVRVPYNGAGPALTSTVSGVTELTFGTAASLGFLKSGKLRALAVTSAQPSAIFPNVPTLASTLPGYEVTSIYGVLVPARTPSAIVQKLNAEINNVLQMPEVRDRMLVAGVEPAPGTPEAFTADIKTEMAKVGKVIRGAGIKND